MNFDAKEIEVGGNSISIGTGLYDTKFDRVLWVKDIEGLEISVEPRTAYEVDKPTGRPRQNQTEDIVDGTRFRIHILMLLIKAGRFEISP